MVLLSLLLIVGSVSCWPSFYPAGCCPGWHSSLLNPNPYCLLFWGTIVSRFWPESPIRGLFSLPLLLEMTLLYPVVPCSFFHLSSSVFGGSSEWGYSVDQLVDVCSCHRHDREVALWLCCPAVCVANHLYTNLGDLQLKSCFLCLKAWLSLQHFFMHILERW